MILADAYVRISMHSSLPQSSCLVYLAGMYVSMYLSSNDHCLLTVCLFAHAFEYTKTTLLDLLCPLARLHYMPFQSVLLCTVLAEGDSTFYSIYVHCTMTYTYIANRNDSSEVGGTSRT